MSSPKTISPQASIMRLFATPLPARCSFSALRLSGA